MRTANTGVVAIATLLACCGSTFAQPPAEPRGLYILNDDKKLVPFPDPVLKDPLLSGVSLRARWDSVEPEDGKFDWSYFDAEVARAKAAGKTVLLRVITNFKGKGIPAWLYKAGAQRFSFRDGDAYQAQAGQLEIPVPWDPVFLSRWKRLIRNMGEHFNSEKAVVLIQMAGPDFTGGEMHLPKTPADKKHWSAIGYTKNRLANSWNQIVDTFAEAFPDKFVALNVSMPIYQDGVVYDVIEHARARLGPRFAIQHNSLCAKIVPGSYPHKWVSDQRGRALIGFMQLVPVTPLGAWNGNGSRWGGTLERGLQIGLDTDMKYLEVYPADAKNRKIRPTFEQFVQRMQ
jgi:hypothetical protein